MGRLWQLVYKENEPNFECIFGLFFIDENSKLLSRFYLSFFSGPSKYFSDEKNISRAVSQKQTLPLSALTYQVNPVMCHL